MSRYHINSRKEGGEFRLFNFDAIAGNRLYHGEPKRAGATWPFNNDAWNHFKTKAEADTAGARLQRYLEATEPETKATATKTKK